MKLFSYNKTLKTLAVVFAVGTLLFSVAHLSFAQDDDFTGDPGSGGPDSGGGSATQTGSPGGVNPDTGDPDSGGGSATQNPNTGGGSATQNPNTGGGSATQTGSQSGQTQTFGISNPLQANSIGEVVLDFVQIFSYIVILLAVLCLIWVGFQYIIASSQGNSSKIAELHGYLLWIVVGIAVVIGARVIVQVVINTLSATGTVNSGIIQSANNALKTQ